MAKNRKAGPITQAELDFIRANMKNMSAAEIAEELGRSPETIEKQMRQMDIGGKSDILDLKKRADWKQIQEQFTPEEIEIFKSHWAGVIAQFKEEIYYTESLQIIAAIKHDILSNRVLHDQMKIKKDIEQLERQVQGERDSINPDKDLIIALETQMSALAMAEQVNGKEFREGSSKLMAVLKELKALRADRVAKVTDMKTSFQAWMRTIIEDPFIKKDLGGYMEKCRLAMEKEEKRLGSPYKYVNGEIDRPVLNDRTIDIREEEESNNVEESN